MEAIVITPKKHYDSRGYFCETFNSKRYRDLGVDVEFVQDNRSLSVERGILRGLHFQKPPHAQAKLVSCTAGAIYDVAVDIRLGSPNYGRYIGVELSAQNGKQFFIPVGFAHGFVTLQPMSEVEYKCSDYYAPATEGTVHWNSVNIDWPLSVTPILSDKDTIAPTLADLESPFIFGENS